MSLAVAPAHRWRAFAVAVGVTAMTILDLNKVNVALPSIETDLGASGADLQLVVAGYALAFGLALIPAGRLGDVLDRKRIFVWGLVAFGVASLVCGAAVSPQMLVVARVLQGLTAGVLTPQVLGLIQVMFTGRERGRALGMFGAIIGLATAFGPTLGGLLIAVGGTDLGWRLGFWFNVPLAIVLVVLAARWLPQLPRAAGRPHIDVVGILLVGVAVFAIMLPFSATERGDGSSDASPLRWLWLVLCAAAVAVFVWWERRTAERGKAPVLDLRLLQRRSYRYGLLVGAFYFAAIPSVFLVNTLFLQQGLGVAPVFAGMVSIPFALSSAVTAWLGGRLVFRLGRTLVVIGLVGVIVGVGVMLVAGSFLPPEFAPWGIAVGMLVGGAGAGFVISPNQTLTLSEIPPAQGGVAGSVGQVGQRVGTAVGVSIATAAFYGAVSSGGGTPSLADYEAAFRGGFIVALVFLGVTLLFALMDRGTLPARTGAIPTVTGSTPAAGDA